MAAKRTRTSVFASLNSLNKNVGKPSQLSKHVQVMFDSKMSSLKLQTDSDQLLAPDYLDLDSDVETVETISPAEPVSLEYRIIGLTWYTPQLVNTCHMDTFLSAFVRQVRQTHGRFLKKITYNDTAGKALIEIGKHTLATKNLLDSMLIKKLWLDAVLDQPVQLPFDAIGYEQFSIFQHLTQHSGFYLETKCRCGTQFLSEKMLRGLSLRDILAILKNQTGSNSCLPTCITCHSSRSFVSFLTLPTNWLITILYEGNDVPDFDEIDPVIVVQKKVYKLAYLAFGIAAQYTGHGIGHLVSLQRIRGHWFIYDGLKAPSFAVWDNAVRYDRPGAVLQSIVYFAV